jgi:hypothetical protein
MLSGLRGLFRRDDRFPTNPSLRAWLDKWAGSPDLDVHVAAELVVSTLLIETPEESTNRPANPSAPAQLTTLNAGGRDLALVFTDEEALHRAFPATTHRHNFARAPELFEMFLELGFDGAILNWDSAGRGFELQANTMAWIAAGLPGEYARPGYNTAALATVARDELDGIVEITDAYFGTARDWVARRERPVLMLVGASRWDRDRRRALIDRLTARLRRHDRDFAVVSLPAKPSQVSELVRVAP